MYAFINLFSHQLEMIEERLEKTIGGLAAVQLSSPLTPPSTARYGSASSPVVQDTILVFKTSGPRNPLA